MAKQKEKKFVDTIIRQIEQLDGMVLKMSIAPGMTPTGQYVSTNRPGTPDLWVTHRLWTGWLEAKSVKGKLSENQRSVINRINSIRKGSAYIIREGENKQHRIEDSGGSILKEFSNAFELLMVLHTLHYQELNAGDILQN